MSDFFSCDWGTTSFRLRRVNAATGELLAERREPTGVRALFSSCPVGDASARERTFAEFLRGQLRLLEAADREPVQGAPVVISGMASSSVGWRELRYAQAPVNLDGAGIVNESIELRVGEHWMAPVHLISGVRTADDIMRGEETEILGLFAEGRHADLAENSIVILPGTHSKHVRVRQRQIIEFHTYMTGELFDVLSAHSLLRPSVQTSEDSMGAAWSDPASRDAFTAGVEIALRRGLAEGFFQTRVRTVLGSVPPLVNRWFLSGLLVGAEVIALFPKEMTTPILLAAAEPLSAAYQLALQVVGAGERVIVEPPAEMARASVRGQRVLLRRLLKTSCYPFGR